MFWSDCHLLYPLALLRQLCQVLAEHVFTCQDLEVLLDLVLVAGDPAQDLAGLPQEVHWLPENGAGLAVKADC
jgi:hypothetical protein